MAFIQQAVSPHSKNVSRDRQLDLDLDTYTSPPLGRKHVSADLYYVPCHLFSQQKNVQRFAARRRSDVGGPWGEILWLRVAKLP
jgi:hypothetical protein